MGKRRIVNAGPASVIGAGNLWHRAVVERAELFIVAQSRGLPHACGVDNGVHISEVGWVIDVAHASAPELLNPAAAVNERQIDQGLVVVTTRSTAERCSGMHRCRGMSGCSVCVARISDRLNDAVKPNDRHPFGARRGTVQPMSSQR